MLLWNPCEHHRRHHHTWDFDILLLAVDRFSTFSQLRVFNTFLGNYYKILGLSKDVRHQKPPPPPPDRGFSPGLILIPPSNHNFQVTSFFASNDISTPLGSPTPPYKKRQAVLKLAFATENILDEVVWDQE